MKTFLLPILFILTSFAHGDMIKTSSGRLIQDNTQFLPAVGLTSGGYYAPLRVDVTGRLPIVGSDTALSLVSTQTKVKSTASVMVDTGDGIGVRSAPLVGLTSGGAFVPILTDGTGRIIVTGGGGTGTVTSVSSGTGLSGGPITGAGTLSLANTAVTAGSYTKANITVDAQGRLTSAANGSAVTSVTAGTGLTGGPITATGTLNLANTAVTPGSYTSANITVDQQGRITLAANGSGGGSSQWTTAGSTGAYIDPVGPDVVGIGNSGNAQFVNEVLQVQSGSNAINTLFLGPGAGNGALQFITLSSDIFALQAVNGAINDVAPLKLNFQGGQVYIGALINDVTLPGYTSCTALTTNASDVVGCTASDERLKKNIVPFERGLEALKDIKPISYQFKDPKDLGIEHSGFSAQNVEKSISEAVRIGSDGMRQLDYWAIIAVQTNAINELRARLEALETKAPAAKKTIAQKAIWQAPVKPKPVLKFKKK
jgi:hypothetical protein